MMGGCFSSWWAQGGIQGERRTISLPGRAKVGSKEEERVILLSGGPWVESRKDGRVILLPS